MKTFEQPLSAKEETEYLEKYRKGDEKAGEILILRNMRLVAHMVKHYSMGADTQELISIGTIGLIKAVKTFNIEKGSRLATYAAKCIDNELLMSFRCEKKKNHEISLNEPIGVDKEGNEINIIDVLENNDTGIPEKYILKCDINTLYDGISNVLNERERKIITLRYGLNNTREVTQREIADAMNISRSYVSRIEKRAVDKLKEYFMSIS